ncbi:MAG: hypothetical protein PHX63_03905, partial [Eubacteriales bacterium]|nr:hypothetical protein [Eubacteriales bacterium]
MPSSSTKGDISSILTTDSYDGEADIKFEIVTLSPVEIFQSVDIVGTDSPRSICPSMVFDTP